MNQIKPKTMFDSKKKKKKEKTRIKKRKKKKVRENIIFFSCSTIAHFPKDNKEKNLLEFFPIFFSLISQENKLFLGFFSKHFQESSIARFS